ncbi:MAG: lysylphosphatidylglycerol synthase domain-containing protein [Pseudomonadota bacterium]
MTTTRERPPRRRGIRWWSGLLLVAGMGIFTLVLSRESPAEVLAACVGAGPGILVILITPIGFYVLHTWGWLILMPGRRPRFGPALRAYIASQALDELGGGLLGEPLKVFVVRDEDRTAGIGSVTLDNLSLLAALGLFLLLGGGVLAWLDIEAISFGRLGIAILGVLGGVAVLGVLFLLGPGLFRDRLPTRLRTPWMARFLDRFGEVAAHNRSFLARHPMRFAASVGLHVLAKAWIVFEVWLTLEIMGVYEPGRALWLGLGKQAAQVTGAAIPAQMGVFVGTLTFLGEALGMVGAVALAVALLRRARSLAWIGIGLALIRGVMSTSDGQ